MRIEPGGSCPRCDSSAYQPGRCLRCGSPLEQGAVCPRCAAARDEKNRAAYRKGYADPEYRRNRLERYRLVGGRCETCGADLKGELHEVGLAWECDHVIALRDGGTNDVGNLRVRCTADHRKKTAADRARRRRR